MPLAELVPPSYASCPDYDFTHGPAVVELCKLAGFIPDPEQELALDWIFAVNDDGKPVAFEFAIVACRQNIKTGLFKMAALGWLFKTNQRLVVWSAHEFNTAQEAHRDMCELIKGCPSLDEQVANYYYGHGDESIELKTGARLIFKARTKGGGRGLSGDKVVLDEAFALQDTHMGALVPLLRTRAEPQLIYGSSAPKADSLLLHDLQRRGRSGKSKRLAYLEWSAPEGGCAADPCDHAVGSIGCALDNRDNWRVANTALGRRITYETVESERDLLPPAEFARELLGWPDEPEGAVSAVISADQWKLCLDAESSISGLATFALDVSPDYSAAALAAAGRNHDGLHHVEITGSKSTGVIDCRAGIDWVVPRCVELNETWTDFAVNIAAGSAAESLKLKLEAAGVTVNVLGSSDVAAACGLLYGEATSPEPKLRHIGQFVLAAALKAARKNVEDGEAAWKWGRKRSTGSIVALYAVTLALFAAEKSAQTDIVPLIVFA